MSLGEHRSDVLTDEECIAIDVLIEALWPGVPADSDLEIEVRARFLGAIDTIDEELRLRRHRP